MVEDTQRVWLPNRQVGSRQRQVTRSAPAGRAAEAAEPFISDISTKSRAPAIHLFMLYQRTDNQVTTMHLRTDLGNKLVLRLGDEGSSRIGLGEQGAGRLLGKGHLGKVYCRVAFMVQEEVFRLAEAIGARWGTVTRPAQSATAA